ncbi:MAG: hypothetical protein HYU69_02000 [Bacteroidetes bacterium]|nr:hypothetical protein [Bacteroidota bacterium]
MKNTSKLKNILQLYTISLDMDEDSNFYLTVISKRTKVVETFIDRSYSVVIGKAFSHMKKEMKKLLLMDR